MSNCLTPLGYFNSANPDLSPTPYLFQHITFWRNTNFSIYIIAYICM